MKPLKGNFLSGLIDLAIAKFPESMEYKDVDDDDYDDYDFEDEDENYSTNDTEIPLDKNYDDGIK